MMVQTQACTRVRSYEDAYNLFLQPANLRRAGWGPDKRALDGVRKTHLRVERGPNDAYYDVMLYQTAMARYYKPTPSGTSYGDRRVVWYNTDPRVSSQNFMYYVLGISWESVRKTTTDGRRVKVGMNKNAGHNFPVRLVYIDGKLDVSQSCDAPEDMPSTTSDERKAMRKEFRKWLRTYEAMAALMGEAGAMYCYVPEVVQAFKQGREFDPTSLVNVIATRGAAHVVNLAYPLGNVSRYEPSFMEVT